MGAAQLTSISLQRNAAADNSGANYLSSQRVSYEIRIEDPVSQHLTAFHQAAFIGAVIGNGSVPGA